MTNITFVIDNFEEFELCSWVVKENVTKDSYVYLEEVKGLKGFEFWPNTPIDIERPASASEHH